MIEIKELTWKTTNPIPEAVNNTVTGEKVDQLEEKKMKSALTSAIVQQPKVERYNYHVRHMKL